MGRKIIQTIYQCDRCDKIPEDGELLWEMGLNDIVCEQCLDEQIEEDSEDEEDDDS